MTQSQVFNKPNGNIGKFTTAVTLSMSSLFKPKDARKWEVFTLKKATNTNTLREQKKPNIE